MTPAEIAAFERNGGAEVAGVCLTTGDVRVCPSATCIELHEIRTCRDFMQGHHDFDHFPCSDTLCKQARLGAGHRGPTNTAHHLNLH